MLQTFANAFKIPNLRKKILYTLFMIVIIRLGASVPVPGVNTTVLENIFNQFSEGLGMIDTLSGGTLKNMSLFAMGVLPYINASIIMQLLTVAVPALEKINKEEDGRKRISKYTRYLAIALSAIQAAGITFALRGQGILKDPSALSYTVAILTMVAGTAILIWIGDQITEKGIGNGISLIIFINILARLPITLAEIWTKSDNSPIKYGLIVGVFILVIAFVVFVQDAERRIPVEYAKRLAGRQVYGGQSNHIPIKVNLSGVMPIIFASSILQFPVAIKEFVTVSGAKLPDGVSGVINALGTHQPIGIILYAVLILFFAYFYTTIQFNPVDFADNLKKSGGVISGIRPGQPTVDFITYILNHITLVGAAFLAIIALLPIVFGNAINMTSLGFTGTSILIAVGVALDILKQLEANMVVRHYKGFLS
ncbi:MAG TPA: preprotein translocase subunit SecY [Clostridiales bacterium]|nr:MAG: preprotein translocase subunit SecY [Clostridiales bacterium GWD2_32_59]HAN09238.1 preprotein translocase subunit SecY [Clostridiales bacterium]